MIRARHTSGVMIGIKKISITFLIVSLLFSGIDPLVFLQSILTGDRSGRSSTLDTLEAAIAPGEREYMLDIGPLVGSTTANYVYASFFNPSGSGRTASIKRIAIRSDAIAASNYVNLTLRRISTASAGTQILASNFPQKNSSSTVSVMEVRTAGVTATLSGTVDSRILGQPLAGVLGSYFSRRDITFDANDEKFVLLPGEGIALYQEAAGDADTNVRLLIEWDETVDAPTARNEFLFAFPRVQSAGGTNYAYNSFFNPGSSGKTAVIRRIWFGAETCDGNGIYTDNLVLKRISTASLGTSVTATNVPKKNTNSSDSVMDFRHTGVTVTEVGGTDARIGHVTPCAIASQAHGWRKIDFHESGEELILQQGQGIALIGETIGDIDQLVRMIIEWDEVPSANTPIAGGEYVWSSDEVLSNTAIDTTLYTFFNPVGSGKTAVVKRIGIVNDAINNAAYSSFQWRRLSAATGGTLIATSSLPKKHTGSATSSMQIRWCLVGCSSAITATYQGTADSKLISVFGADAVSQTLGQYDIVFGANENIILQPGEGIGLYNDLMVSNAAESVKVIIEWEERNSGPTAQGEYLMSVGPINGNAATTYNYVTLFNPSNSAKRAVIKRLGVRVDTVANALYVPIQIRRITSVSGGTLVASSSYPKKHTGSATSTMMIHTTGPVVTYAGATTSRLLVVQTSGIVSSVSVGNMGHKEFDFAGSEPLVLQPGEGIVLYQNPSAGDLDFRVRLLLEWKEQDANPTSQGEYFMGIGPINQVTNPGYVYATLFNPITSAKNYLVRKLGIQANRSGAGSAPLYTPATIRRITQATGGTLTATTSLSKNTDTASSTAEVRSTGVTATFSGATETRMLSVTLPGALGQTMGDYESTISAGDELLLKPGEGLALYQEQTTGDVNLRYHLFAEWDEENVADAPQFISFTISTSTIFFGTVSSSIARYASSTNILGSNTEVGAHTFSVITNATNGYTVSAKGGTLTAGLQTISAIGSTATTSLIGTEQFGLRLTVSGGSGTSTTPYNSSAFAYAATATTSSQVGNATVGDNATTTFSVLYLANIAPLTEPASYTANIVYVVTANF